MIEPNLFNHIHDYALQENPDYLSKQLITYIGNKRLLLKHINNAVLQVKNRLDKSHLRIFDAFSGSGVVSRVMKSHASYLAVNDLEDYAKCISRCYLTNRSSIDTEMLSNIVDNINKSVYSISDMGFIEELYSPKNEYYIKSDDRVFYTRDNAKRIDNYRRVLSDYPQEYHHLLLGPLLSKASIHCNTPGIFKGFYKNKNTGIGQFGGTNRNALSRITGKIELEIPVLSSFECEYDIFQGNTNKIALQLTDLDLVYIDPPYNQHPYGSNYFMLNLITNYIRPNHISKVSGIPKDWNRSDYNNKNKSKTLFIELLNTLDTKFFIISFNNEGFITPEDMRSIINDIGNVSELEIQYNAFRGSRNLKNRNTYVTEQLFIVEKFCR